MTSKVMQDYKPAVSKRLVFTLFKLNMTNPYYNYLKYPICAILMLHILKVEVKFYDLCEYVRRDDKT